MVILYYLDPLLITHQCGKQNKNAVPKAMSGSLPRIWKKESAVSLIVTSVGSPPRVWGKVQPVVMVEPGVRITPTRVGKRTAQGWYQQRTGDHPHACGEKVRATQAELVGVGSPPHVWGKGSFHG